MLLAAAQAREKDEVDTEKMRALIETLRERFDYVLIDCPAGIELGFKNAVAGADEAIVVCTPEVSAVRDVDRVVGLLGNTFQAAAHHQSPAPAARAQRARCSRSKTSTRFCALPLLGVIADEPEIIVTTNRGEPLALRTDTPTGAAYHAIAARVAGEDVAAPMPPEAKESFFERDRLALRREARDDRVPQAALRQRAARAVDGERAVAPGADDRSSRARARDDRGDEARFGRRHLALRRSRSRARSKSTSSGRTRRSRCSPTFRSFRSTGRTRTPKRRAQARAASWWPPPPAPRTRGDALPTRRRRRRKRAAKRRDRRAPRKPAARGSKSPDVATLTLGSGAKRYVRNFNWLLAVAAASRSRCIGVVCIQSAGLHDADAAGEFKKQILYICSASPLMIGVSFVDYRNWQRWAPALYVVNLLLLLFIMRGGHSALGAQRWISLGPLGTFQPSEPAKLVARDLARGGVLPRHATKTSRSLEAAADGRRSRRC